MAKFPKIFNIARGGFPLILNRVEFYNYKGSIPPYEWYSPNLRSPDKRVECFQLYEEQFNNQFTFDFLTVAIRDGEIQFFRTLTKQGGTYIGVDPSNHLTIPPVPFEGVNMRYVLCQVTLISVPRPTKENHYFQQILWLEHICN